MTPVKWHAASVLAIGLTVSILLISCGGGSSSSPSPPPPPSSPPTLTSLSPIVAMQNSGGFTLTANGANFTNSSQVLFNGTAQTTAFVSSTQIQAQIPSIGQTGTFPVTVQTGSFASKAVNFYVVPQINKQGVSVSSGAETSGVDIGVRGLTPTLSLIAVGIGTSAGSTGVSVNRGGSAQLLLVGKGIVAGAFFQFSGNSSDVTVTQPLTSDFSMTTDNMPAVNLSISVSASAALGARDILVTNPGGEIAVYVGGLMIAAGT